MLFLSVYQAVTVVTHDTEVNVIFMHNDVMLPHRTQQSAVVQPSVHLMRCKPPGSLAEQHSQSVPAVVVS